MKERIGCERNIYTRCSRQLDLNRKGNRANAANHPWIFPCASSGFRGYRLGGLVKVLKG